MEEHAPLLHRSREHRLEHIVIRDDHEFGLAFGGAQRSGDILGVDGCRLLAFKLINDFINAAAISQQNQSVNATLRHPFDQAAKGFVAVHCSHRREQCFGNAKQH
ncbi:MAG: Uncharacterised protein [Prochlorococcus marinus str. MIT 9215]|nr:MAG: Uncharacterised protein [Prochlorococcus marinus str. MIT 9215]